MSSSQIQRLKTPRLVSDKPPSKRNAASAVSSASTSSKSSKKRSKKSVNILVAIKPVNLQSERTKFFESGCKYDPQFLYASEDFDCSKLNSECTGPSARYLPQVSELGCH